MPNLKNRTGPTDVSPHLVLGVSGSHSAVFALKMRRGDWYFFSLNKASSFGANFARGCNRYVGVF